MNSFYFLGEPSTDAVPRLLALSQGERFDPDRPLEGVRLFQPMPSVEGAMIEPGAARNAMSRLGASPQMTRACDEPRARLW